MSQIRLTLVLSTGHVTKETADLLNGTPHTEWPCLGGPYFTYGWQLWCATEQGTIPDDLWGVMQFARAKGCEHVLFDMDEAPEPELPFWEW